MYVKLLYKTGTQEIPQAPLPVCQKKADPKSWPVTREESCTNPTGMEAELTVPRYSCTPR